MNAWIKTSTVCARSLMVLLLSLSFAACSKKGSGGSAAAGVGPAATEGQTQNPVDQSQAQFEIVEQQGVYSLGKFTVLVDGKARVFTGLVGADAKGPLVEEADRNRGYANVLSAEGLGILSVITGEAQSDKGRLYIFIKKTETTYTLMTNAISIERRAGLDRIRSLIRQVVRKKDLTVSEAFALLIQTHLNQQNLSFEELSELLTSENAPVVPGDDEDSDNGGDWIDDDSDYGDEVVGTPQPDITFDLNDNVVIRTNPTGIVPRGTPVQPTTADRTPPWRAGQSTMPHYDEVPGSEIDPRWAHGDRVRVKAVPQIPPTNSRGVHTWPQCFASKAWTAGGWNSQDSEGNTAYCHSSRCTNRWDKCCSPAEGASWCRIIEAGESDIVFEEEEDDRENDRPQNNEAISLRVRCGHESHHSNHFQSGSNLTAKGESQRIHEIDMCIPNAQRRGVQVQGGVGEIRHSGWFGLGSTGYFGKTELFVEVDFNRGSAYDVSRFIRDVDIVGSLRVLDERSLMIGPAATGRAEFLKTFYVQGPNSRYRDTVNLACEVTYHRNLQCR